MKRNKKKAITIVLAIAFILISLTNIANMECFQNAENKTITTSKKDRNELIEKQDETGKCGNNVVEIDTSMTEETTFIEEIKNEETKTEITKPVEKEEKTTEVKIPENQLVGETEKQEAKPIEYLTLIGEYASIDKSTYTSEELELINTILVNINENISNPNIQEEKLFLQSNFTFESYYKVATYFYVYYGQKRAVSYTFDLVNSMSDYGYLVIRYDDIREFEAEMDKNRKKIDCILSGFTVGSEEHILRQISEYLKDNIVYTKGYYDLSCALNGRSVCNGYALAFNAMANRAGIKSDICIGESNNGGKHAWNRVTLQDGSYRFYDITFYDSTQDINYLYSTTSFHGPFLINDYSMCLITS